MLTSRARPFDGISRWVLVGAALATACSSDWSVPKDGASGGAGAAAGAAGALGGSGGGAGSSGASGGADGGGSAGQGGVGGSVNCNACGPQGAPCCTEEAKCGDASKGEPTCFCKAGSWECSALGGGGGSGFGGTAGGGGFGGIGTGATGGSASACDQYCGVMVQSCTGSLQQFPNATCKPICSLYPPGQIGDTAGNSLWCRQWTIQSAIDPKVYCAPAGPSGGGQCGSICDNYCMVVMAMCSASYSSAAECLSKCQSMKTTGSFSTQIQSGDNVECRLNMALQAVWFPGSCGAAGLNAVTPCVGP